MAIALAGAALLACSSPEVPYTEMDGYFFRNDAPALESARIDSQASFESLFGSATLMGKRGRPTPVDFSSEFVIAVVLPVTDVSTELEPVSLTRKDGSLIFSYRKIIGEPQTWTMQPVLLVKVDRKHEAAVAVMETD